MSKFTRFAAAATLLAALTTAGVVTAGTASAAPAGGVPDLSISTDRRDCTTTVTNNGPVTAINSAVFTTNFGGITSPAEDIAPGATRVIRNFDCTGFPALTFTYDANGDSNPFDNITVA